MKSVTIVSIGMGDQTRTKAAEAAIAGAEVLLGAPRMLAAFSDKGKAVYSEYLPERVRSVIENDSHESFAILVSGDAGFFSAADKLTGALDGFSVTVLPGVSSVNSFFAKLHRPYQGAALVSCHGRDCNLTDTVRRNVATFALTGGNVPELSKRLTDAGFGDLTATVGENLDTDIERLFSCPVAALAERPVAALAVLLIDNPAPDARVRAGIPDDAFIRGDVPMTKAEVRAVILSKLALSPTDICLDVGAGTGSVTVEMALAAYEGHVYAVEKNEVAIDLIARNLKAFHLGNVSVLHGVAPEALTTLPSVDAAFIGGSGGQMRELFDCILTGNPHARIVVSAIALESVNAALSAFAAHGIEPETVQLSVAKAKSVSGLHMMLANNPVFLISGGGR